MTVKTLPGGTFTVSEDLTVTRVGYGAMQLAGPGVFGPPRDRDAAIAVLREAMELGITRTSTPATTTARTSPTRSSRKPCTPTPARCTPSPPRASRADGVRRRSGPAW
jgi:hypothetical protein